MTNDHGSSAFDTVISTAVAIGLWLTPIWLKIVSDVHESLPTILQVLGVFVAVSTVWRNVMAIRRGDP